MDGGAWWAAVNGAAKSRTRLKRRSSSRWEVKSHGAFLSSGVNSWVLLLLLLLLSRSHQAPLSLGFSGQEHWSGLPFLSPMHESEK